MHIALLDYIAHGDTSICAPFDDVKDRINQLSHVNSQLEKTGFQIQFEVIMLVNQSAVEMCAIRP